MDIYFDNPFELLCALDEALLFDDYEFDDNYRVYGYTLDEWNSFPDDLQLAIEQREEYNLQHPEQLDW